MTELAVVTHQLTRNPESRREFWEFLFELVDEGATEWLAEVFPLTHFLRIVRGIVLRDASLADMTADLWPLVLFFVVGMALATLRFRKRLD